MGESIKRAGAAIPENAHNVPEQLAEAVRRHRRDSGCISDSILGVHPFHPKLVNKIRRQHRSSKVERLYKASYWTRLLREDAAIWSCHKLKTSTALTSAEQRLESDRRLRDRMFGNINGRRSKIRTNNINKLIRVAAPVIDAGLPVYFVTITPGGQPATALSLIDAALDAARRQSIAFGGFIEVEKSGALSFHGFAFSSDFQRRSRVRETKRAFADGLISLNFPRAVKGPAIDVRRITTHGSLVKRARYTYKSYGTPLSEARRLGLGQRTFFRFCKWTSQRSEDFAEKFLSQSRNSRTNNHEFSREPTVPVLGQINGNSVQQIIESASSILVDVEYGQKSSHETAPTLSRRESEFKTGKPVPRRIHTMSLFALNTIVVLIILFKSIYEGPHPSLFRPEMLLEPPCSEASIEYNCERPGPVGVFTPPKPVPPRSRGPPCVTRFPRVVSHGIPV